MDDHINRGDLVRWIVDYELFAADATGKTYPLEPVYQYGIVVEVSPEDPSMVVIYNPYQAEWWIGNKAGDQIEIISKAKNMSKSDNESTVEIVTIGTGKRSTRWLCAHCKTGIVISIPSECPECGKLLNEEVARQEE